MSVLVVAAGVLLFTTPVDADEYPDDSASDSSSLNLPSDDGNTSLDGVNPIQPSPEPTPEPTPEPSPQPAVESVTITYANRPTNDFSASPGERVDLRVRIEPVGIDEEIHWMSSDQSIFEVVATNAEGTSARVTGIGRGRATLSVSVGGVEAECIVRVR